MSRTRQPTLDELAGSDRPGWLWDIDQLRIAWANAAGLAFFEAESLFDLLDKHFDAAEAGVAEIARIGAGLDQGTTSEAVLAFPSSGLDQGVVCTCWPHRLADGRRGLLVIANVPPPAAQIGIEIAAEIFNRIPFALMVFDATGARMLHNPSAARLFGIADARGAERKTGIQGLSEIIEGEARARKLISRVMEAGLVSETVRVRTAIGERIHRISALRLATGGPDSEAMMAVVFDDITERRRQEHRLAENTRRLEDLVVAAADFTFELDAELNITALSQGFEALTGTDPAELIGTFWLDHGGEGDPDLVMLDAALEAKAPFAVTLSWSEGPETVRLRWSAVPLTDASGVFGGYRGLGVRARAGDDPACTENEHGTLDARERRTFEAIASALTTDTGVGAGLSVPQEAGAGGSAATDKADKAGEEAAAVSDEPGAEPQSVAEEVIAEAVHQRYLAMLDAMPAAVIVHREFDLLYANEAAAGLLGFVDRSALADVGHLFTLFPDQEPALEAMSGDEPVTLTRNADHGQSVLATRSPVDWPGGAAHQMLLAPAPPRQPGKDENEKPQEAERPDADAQVVAELRAILNIATDGILVLDGRGRIDSANAGAAAIFGRDSADLMGETLASQLTKTSAKSFRAYLKSVAAAGIESLLNDGREITAIEKNGGEISLFVSVGRLDDGDARSKTRYCAVIRDLTQWKHTEAELRGDKEKAERASAGKSAFIARISHELRTPLNAIIGFADVMRSEKFGPIENPKYKAYVNDIHASSDHVLSLINDLLDLAKVEAGKLQLDFAAVDLGEVIEGSVRLMQPEASRARVIIRSSLGADLPAVKADRRSMRQIMLNLLSNAVKFTDPGGQVTISVNRIETDALIIRIRDTGIGMNEDDLERALQPFQQISRPGRDDPAGTGLGLPLTRALTEANHAAFKIESTPGSGTNVEIAFPAARVLTG